jgi:hypothetical protein
LRGCGCMSRCSWCMRQCRCCCSLCWLGGLRCRALRGCECMRLWLLKACDYSYRTLWSWKACDCDYRKLCSSKACDCGYRTLYSSKAYDCGCSLSCTLRCCSCSWLRMPPIHPCTIRQFCGRCNRGGDLDDVEGIVWLRDLSARAKCAARA